MGILASNKGVLLGLICLSQVSCDSSINYHLVFYIVRVMEQRHSEHKMPLWVRMV